MTDHSQITEFVGTAIGDTIGLVIPRNRSFPCTIYELGEYRLMALWRPRG